MRSFGENRWRPSSVNLIGNNDLEGIVIYSFDIDRKGFMYIINFRLEN